MLNLLENPVITRKTYNRILVTLYLSAILSKNVQRHQDLNNNIQHISNKDITQKLNVINKDLATKESSEYYKSTHLKIPYMFQHQSQV